MVLLLAGSGCGQSSSRGAAPPANAADAGDGATVDAPAQDAGADTGCTGSQCAGDSGADAACAQGTKSCGGQCVLEDPAHGCAATSCSPCTQQPATCKAGACAQDTCASGTADCDGNPANGCEVTLATDPDNCGACGHVCSLPHATSTKCVLGGCQPATCAAPYADCDLDPNNGCEADLQTDEYNCGKCGNSCNGAGCNAGSCGPAPTTLASNQTKAWGITLDSTYVYFTTDNSVAKVPKAGGSVVTLGYQDKSVGVAVDATNAYFTSASVITGQNSLQWVPLGGGTPTKLVGPPDCSHAGGIAQAGGTLYFVCFDGGILSEPITGGAPTVLTTNVISPNELTIDSSYAYYTNMAPTGSVMRVPLAGGTATTLAGGQDNPVDVAIDGTSAYWTNQGTLDGSDGSVVKAPLAGGTPTTLVSGLHEAVGIAVDGSNVYFTTVGTNHAELARVPKSGGTPFIIAFGGAPRRVALDSSNVYWTDTYDDAVYKIAK